MKKTAIITFVKRAVLLATMFLTVFASLAFPIMIQADGINNLYDFTKSYCGIVKSDGANIYSHRYHTSDYIKVSSGDVITFGPAMNYQNQYLSTFDSSKNVLQRISDIAQFKIESDLGAGYSILSYVIPNGVSYVRVTTLADFYNTFAVTNNAPFNKQTYLSYLDSAGLRSYYDFILNRDASLQGKKLLWCGDSIGVGLYEHYYPGTDGTNCTKYNKDNGEHPAWAQRVASLLGGVSATNVSRGGASISTKRANIPNLFTQVKSNASSSYDYIVIEGGSVDVGGSNGIKAPLGKLSDSFELSAFDGEDTFIGALERCFYYATKQAPKAHIVFLIAYSMPKFPNNANAWEEYWQYVPVVCEKWGVSYIDLYNNDYVNKVFDTNRTPNGNSTTAFYYDGLHVSPMGYSVTSFEIAMELASVPVYEQSTRHIPDNVPEILRKGSTTAETTEGKTEPVTPYDKINNLFVKGTISDGRMDSKGTDISDPAKYFTTDYISVTPGSTLYFGAANPDQGYQLIGFDNNKKAVNGWVSAKVMTKFAALDNGNAVLAYKIPAGVTKVRITFHVGIDPLITIDQPFDKEVYTDFLNRETQEQTTAAVTTQTSAPMTTATPVTTTFAPVTTTPVTTAEVTAAAPITTQTSDVTVSPESSSVEPPISSDSIPESQGTTANEPGTSVPTSTDSSAPVTTASESPSDPSVTTSLPVPKDTETETDDTAPAVEKGCGSYSGIAFVIILTSLLSFVGFRRKDNK